MKDHTKFKEKLLKWGVIFCLSLFLLSGSVLIYQWRDKKQLQKVELERIKQEVEQYELQKSHLVSINNLSQDPKIREFFTDLLQTYAQKLANEQSLDIS